MKKRDSLVAFLTLTASIGAAETASRPGQPAQRVIEDPKPSEVARFAKVRSALLAKGLPFEPNLLLRKDWREQLRSNLAALPEMRTDLRLAPNEVRGVVLARRLVLSSRLRLDEDTVIIADSVTFVGDDNQPVIYAPGKSVTVRAINGVTFERLTPPAPGAQRSRRRIVIVTGSMDAAEKKLIGDLAQVPVRLASMSMQFQGENLDGVNGQNGSNGPDGYNGNRGADGAPGLPGNCSISASGGEGDSGGTGGPGENANPGNAGGHGQNGGPIDVDFTGDPGGFDHHLSSRGGTGGVGGDAGQAGSGGPGGTGGRGGDAASCGYPANGGRGGKGGQSGDGGRGAAGGIGGNGGVGGSIRAVTCYPNRVTYSNIGGGGGMTGNTSTGAPPGSPGEPGEGGSGAWGGADGPAGGGGSYGNVGGPGSPLFTGIPGQPGPPPQVVLGEGCSSGNGAGTGGTEDQCDPYGTEAAQCSYEGGEFNRDPQVCACEFNSGTFTVGGLGLSPRSLATGGKSSVWRGVKRTMAPSQRTALPQ